jgi:hypothetical protein
MIADNCCRKASKRPLVAVVATGETVGMGHSRVKSSHVRNPSKAEVQAEEPFALPLPVSRATVLMSPRPSVAKSLPTKNFAL